MEREEGARPVPEEEDRGEQEVRDNEGMAHGAGEGAEAVLHQLHRHGGAPSVLVPGGVQGEEAVLLPAQLEAEQDGGLLGRLLGERGELPGDPE